MSSWLAALLNFITKAAPYLAMLIAYWKGKKDMGAEIEKKNLEKQQQYAEIKANKSGSIDDDLGRMQDGTY